MSVKIRLTRLGRKKSPFYRIVAIDSRKARNGKYIDLLGYYNPSASNEEGVEVSLNQEKLLYWLKSGAELSDIVRKFASSLKEFQEFSEKKSKKKKKARKKNNKPMAEKIKKREEQKKFEEEKAKKEKAAAKKKVDIKPGEVDSAPKEENISEDKKPAPAERNLEKEPNKTVKEEPKEEKRTEAKKEEVVVEEKKIAKQEEKAVVKEEDKKENK